MSGITEEQKEEALAYYKKIWLEYVQRLANIDYKKLEDETRGVIVSPDYSQIDVLEVHTYQNDVLEVYTYQNDDRKDAQKDI